MIVRHAKHILLKGIEVDPGFSSLNDSDLWALHDREIAVFHNTGISQASASPAVHSLLDVKIELAERMLKRCHFCERRCGVNRFEQSGNCHADAVSHISSEFLHRGEEPELIPSHTIFFEGCNFSCAYCQNWQIATKVRGPAVDVERLCKVIEARHRQGSANVNFVGGEPTPHLHTILKTARRIESDIPLIWNSNMYMSAESQKLLDGVIDLYLADFRYGDDVHAEKYSGIKDYWEITTRNFLEAKRQSGLLVRHLVLPGHVECCTKPIVDWCAEHLGKDVRFNLMFQYRPEYRAFAFPEIDRSLSQAEVRRALAIVKEAGLTNVV